MPIMDDTTIDLATMVYTWWNVENALRARRDDILNAIEEGQVSPTSDLMNELAEINVALGDA